MILLKIDPGCMRAVEFECQAPWSVDVDRVARRSEPSQRVKVVARDVHVFGPLCLVQGFQSPQDAGIHPRIDLGGGARCPKFGKRLVFERLDHGEV